LKAERLNSSHSGSQATLAAVELRPASEDHEVAGQSHLFGGDRMMEYGELILLVQITVGRLRRAFHAASEVVPARATAAQGRPERQSGSG